MARPTKPASSSRVPRRGARALCRLVGVLLLLWAVVDGSWSPPASFAGGLQGPAAVGEEEALVTAAGAVVGRHYRQTGVSGMGFDVREPFYGALLDFGGPEQAGFPVSMAFAGADGCQYQAFQVLLLQACPDSGVAAANTFELLQ